jgi:hypothetical protein
MKKYILTILSVTALFILGSSLIRINSTDKIILINDPANEKLNKLMEYPYLNPADYDKFYGKLPRLYLHGTWKLKVVPNPGEKTLGPGEYVFDDEGMKQGFWKADYNILGWEDFYVPRRIMLKRDNSFGIKFIKNDTERDKLRNSIPPSRLSNLRVYAADGYSYQAVDFKVPPEQKGKRVILHFQAIDNLPVVYVNGTEVARPENIMAGGAVDFHWIDITENVKKDDINRLVVRTYNLFYDCEDALSPHFNNNGVWYPAWIEFWPELHAGRMKIIPVFPSGMLLEVPVINKGKTATRALKVRVEPWKGQATSAYDASGKVWEKEMPVQEFRAEDTTLVRFRMNLEGIRSWSPDSPYLYSVKIYDGDKLAGWETFGMRSLKRDQTQHILLNGMPVFLFGVSFDEGMFDEPYEARYYKGLFQGHADGQMMIRFNKNGFLQKLLEFYKSEVNVNAVLRAELLPEVFYQLCDEVGIMRIDEPNLADNSDVMNKGLVRNKFLLKGTLIGFSKDEMPAILKQWDAYSESFVKILYNHPSLIAWSTATEPWFKPKEWTRGTIEAITKQKDTTRLVCAQMSHFFNTENGKSLLWGKDGGFNEVDIDYTHNRPCTYNGSLGLEMVKSNPLTIHHWENLSREVYFSSGGGRPLLACPVLLMTQGIELYPPSDKIAPDLYNSKTGYNRKWLCRLLEEDSLYHYNMRFVAKLTGVYNLVSGNLMRDRYIAFEQQRLAEIFRINATLYRGLASSDVPLFASNVKMFRGDIMDPSIITTSVVSESMKRAYQRVLPVLDWHFKSHLFAGEGTKYTLFVVNDSDKKIARGEVLVRLLAIDGFSDKEEFKTAKEVFSTSIKTEQVSPAEKFSHEVLLNVPFSAEPGHYTIELVFKSSGKEIGRNQYPVVIGERLNTTVKTGKRIALYKSGNKSPEGTCEIMDKLNIQYNNIRDFNSLEKYDLLIIAPNSIDSLLIKNGTRIHDWISKGKKVLCLEQDYIGKYPFLQDFQTDISYTTPDKSGFHVAEPVRYDHPVFAGISNIKDWDVFNGATGNIYNSVIMPLTESVLLLGSNTVDAYWKWVTGTEKFKFGMVVAECREGEGICLLSQVIAVSRYDIDPVARKYLNQLLTYAASDSSGYGQ